MLGKDNIDKMVFQKNKMERKFSLNFIEEGVKVKEGVVQERLCKFKVNRLRTEKRVLRCWLVGVIGEREQLGQLIIFFFLIGFKLQFSQL